MKASSLYLSEEIIDQKFSDKAIYLLTNRFIYKINPHNQKILDRTFLPQRFNNLLLIGSDIVLVSNNEITILDSVNLSYKGGIGIEIGDYKPIIQPGASDYLYLIEEAGIKGRVKLFNLKTGRKVKQISLPKIIHFSWEGKNLIICDVDNQLSLFDERLNRRGQIKFSTRPEKFRSYFGGYLVFNEQGVFWFSKKGKLLDFQVFTSQQGIKDYGDFFFLTDSAVFFIDTLTLRFRAIEKNSFNLNKILNVDGYYIGIGNKNGIYVTQKDDPNFKEISVEKVLPEELKASPRVSFPDSLYYIQIGAFSKFDYAKKLCDSMIEQGIPLFIDSTTLYLVKIGGFLDKKSGFEFLENLGIMGWITYEKSIGKMDSIEFSIREEIYLFKNGIIIKRE